MKNNVMVINRETAMLLWNKVFGKSCKVKDFAGREIIKAAYSDRGSSYGWNLDHIFPQSKGGKTTESNLVCCHIQTNDEKADKFPCFSANDKKFEIVKVQNHYEIKPIKTVNNGKNVKNEKTEDVNFFDPASGIRFFKRLTGIQNKKVFVGTVTINLRGIQNTAVLDFIADIFDDKEISYSRNNNGFLYSSSNSDIKVRIVDYNMPQKENIADMLDRCILLNTYLGKYFLEQSVISGYQIFYGVHCDSERMNKLDCLVSCNDYEQSYVSYMRQSCPLVINELVKINTEAEQKLQEIRAIGRDKLSMDIYEYNYVYTKLAEDLDKQVK